MYKHLDKIESPADLAQLGPRERIELAEELRDRIMRVVSKNGGHFGSNFGVIELTIALHSVFDSPLDKIIFDTSHQCYAHKLLTGRHKDFDSLRTHGGISGFCHKEESDHDITYAGHAGTAASIALGLSAGRSLQKKPGHTIAVVGDAAMVSGMTFEALNHAGEIRRPVLIILNDNDMSISYPVGGLHRTLDKIRTRPLYSSFKREIEQTLDRLGGLGEKVHGSLAQLKELAKRAFIGGALFEDLGLRYFGPIDGHDTEALIEILADVRKLDEPVLLHILTKKGAGWAPALADPIGWHAARGFLPEDQEPRETDDEEGKELSVVDAVQSRPRWTKLFEEAIVELAAEDQRVVALTAAMPGGTGLSRFATEFPERFFDVGICEQHGTGFASGLQLAGLHPVFAVYSTFLQRGYDQVLHDVAIQGNPVVFCLDRAGLVGDDGVTHQGLFDISFLRCIPKLVLLAPKDGPELVAMLRWAVASNEICAIRWPRASVPVDLSPICRPIVKGEGEILREGDGQLSFFAYGAMVELCLAAADLLKRGGIRAGVVNARFAKPFPSELLKEVAENNELVLTVEDHVRQGGFGSAALEGLAETAPELLSKLRILGVADHFVDHGARDIQLAEEGLDVAGIVKQAKQALRVNSEAKGPLL